MIVGKAASLEHAAQEAIAEAHIARDIDRGEHCHLHPPLLQGERKVVGGRFRTADALGRIGVVGDEKDP